MNTFVALCTAQNYDMRHPRDHSSAWNQCLQTAKGSRRDGFIYVEKVKRFKQSLKVHINLLSYVRRKKKVVFLNR